MSSFSNAISSAASFFNGWRSTPGTIPGNEPARLTSVAVSREHRRAKTDRLDTELLSDLKRIAEAIFLLSNMNWNTFDLTRSWCNRFNRRKGGLSNMPDKPYLTRICGFGAY
jgi:hypothetical protein